MEPIYLKLNELKEIISNEIKSEIKKISNLKIACIIVGNDPASMSYLNGMKKSALNLGIEVDIIQYEKTIKEDQFLIEIDKISKDEKYYGIIIQDPLPENIDPYNVAVKLDYKKDIDGITPYNQGLLFCGKPFLIPATAFAVGITLEYIKEKYQYNPVGKNVTIIGRSLTVGKPLIHILLNKNLTPTIVHTKTENIKEITNKSDIIIASCGVPELITDEWIKNDSIIIDVGIHSIDDNNEKGFRLCGDIDSKSILKKAKILTAVPGGIGVITSVLVFANTVKSYFMINKNENFNFKFEKKILSDN